MGLTVPEEIIAAIAEAEDTEPAALDVSLQDCVETDAIRQLVAHDSDAWTLRFRVPEHSVTITGDGAVLVDDTRTRTID